jgi:lipopolysaccharide export system permease protein
VFSLLHRTIFYELLKVFALAFVGLTGLLLLAGVIAEATRNGFGPAQILAAIPLLVPSMMPYTLPTTTLFATCIVYGRLAADNEILALKAAGVHVAHVLWPAAVLGVAVSAATFFLYYHTIPYTHYVLRSQVVGDVEELLYGMLRKDGCIRHPRINYTIYVKRVQGRKLIDAQFMRRDPKGEKYDVIAYAKEAELLVDLRGKQIHVLMRHCNVTSDDGRADVHFESQVWPVELPSDFGGITNKARAADMTWPELFEYRDRLRDEKDKLETEIAAHQTAINLGTAPPHFPEHVRQLLDERRRRDNTINGIGCELQARPAFALGCLCFVLIGCPVGIWFSRSDYLSAFITCFLPIVLVYYPLMLCGINMARAGRIPPWAGIWLADGLMLLTAAVMFRRLARH